MFIESKLITELGKYANQQARFLIEMLNIVECLIESEYIGFDFIEAISKSLAMLLPSYSNTSLVKIIESNH